MMMNSLNFRTAMTLFDDDLITRCSRAAPSLTGRGVWPLIGRMQKQFFLAEMDYFDTVARVHSGGAL